MKIHRIIGGIAILSTLLIATEAFAQKEPQAPEVDLDAMIEFEGEEFTMGTRTDEEVGRYGDRWFVNEQPDHPVTVDDFHMDVHEVTVEEFALFLTYAGGDWHWHPDQPIEKVAGGYLPEEGAEHQPARYTTWEAADHYCKWAGKRLPTEAEWEFAAAGTDRREFPWGDDGAGCDSVNFFSGASLCHRGVLDVGSQPDGATPEGLHDMAGNVAEWTADWYGEYPEDGDARDNPTGPESGELKVVRGGGHLSSGRWRRTRARQGFDPRRRSSNVGFRCAYDSEPDDGAVRGELTPPADEDRQERDRPKAPRAHLPTIVSEEFGRPGSVVALGGEWFVLDRAHQSISAIDSDDFSVRSVAENLGEAVEMTTDNANLLVADHDSDTILQIDPDSGEVTELIDGQDEPRRVDANGDGLAWFSAETLRYYDFDEEQVYDLAENIFGPTMLSLAGGTVFYTADGTDKDGNIDLDETELSAVNVSEGSEAETLLGILDVFDNQQAAEMFYFQHVYVDPASQQLWVLLRYRGFPNNGVFITIDLDSGNGAIGEHSPRAHDVPMQVVDETVFLPTNNTIAVYASGADHVFTELTPYTRAGGLFATDDYIVWSDEVDGRIYFEELQ